MQSVPTFVGGLVVGGRAKKDQSGENAEANSPLC